MKPFPCQLCKPYTDFLSCTQGKTTITIYRLLKSSTDNKIYITYTRGLKEYAKKIFNSLARGLDSNPASFSTVEDFCLGLVAGQEAFIPQKKMTFEIFKDLRFVQRIARRHNLEPYIIWEEIRGVLKQHDRVIPRPEYVETSDDAQTANCVYDIYHQYLDYLQTQQMWDDIDLARTALNSISQYTHRYDEIIVDEVQDLTKIHFQLFCELVHSADGLFFAGDDSQAIHPSKFQWSDIEDIINARRIYQQRWFANIYQRLNENYRNPSNVFELAKAVRSWRAEIMGEDDDLRNVITHKLGGEPVQLIEPKHFKDFRIDIAPSNVMIIVASAEYKTEACEKFGVGSVFTIAEAKGLENQDIVLYKFFDERHICDALKTLCDFFNIYRRTRNYKTLLNLLHVAITRTENRLFIVSESRNVHHIKPLKNFPFQIDKGQVLKDILTTRDDTPEQHFLWATELELANNLTQAEAHYLKAASLGHPLGYVHAYKCKALQAQAQHNYEVAASYYEIAISGIDDTSLLQGLDECKGYLKLAQGDLETASEYFLNAEVTPMTIVQRLCSTKGHQRHEIALNVILKYSSNHLDEFVRQYEIMANISYEVTKVYNICKQYPLADIYFQNRLKFVSRNVGKALSPYRTLNRKLKEVRDTVDRGASHLCNE
ncbi:MAG: hypothetical protein N5P05_001989 [Chroococcopsis gigantea SAG 12.99]|jgi:tetratricopeptide (TPR) repeat protein|nr:hypothetical protein [Chroococcopsis gigantea SAG 12.99]